MGSRRFRLLKFIEFRVEPLGGWFNLNPQIPYIGKAQPLLKSPEFL
jgi:hypothetical protein